MGKFDSLQDHEFRNDEWAARERENKPSLAAEDYKRDTERINRGEKARNVSPQCWREEHGDCECSSLICRCECHRVVIDYFGPTVEADTQEVEGGIETSS